MIMKGMMFIDGEYFYQSYQTAYGKTPRVDLSDMIKALAAETGIELIRAYYYNAKPPIFSDDELREETLKACGAAEQKLKAHSRAWSDMDHARQGMAWGRLMELSRERLAGVGEWPPNEHEFWHILSAEDVLAKSRYECERERLKFYEALRFRGIKVKLTNLRRDPRGKGAYVQKGVDVFLVSDMLALCYQNAYDTAIILTGDADFVQMVEAVQATGKKVYLAGFKIGQSWELRQTCDGFLDLDKTIQKLAPREPVHS